MADLLLNLHVKALRLTRVVEEEGIARLASCNEPPESLHHVLPCGSFIEVWVVIQQHAHVLLTEAKLGGEKVGHAVGVVDAPIQCTV